MDVECFVCGRLYDVTASHAVSAHDRRYRFVCSPDCKAAAIELRRLEAMDELLRRARERGDTEKVNQLEQQMREESWLPPDAPEPG